MWQIQLSCPSTPHLLTWWACACHRRHSNQAHYLMNTEPGHHVNVPVCRIRSKCTVKSYVIKQCALSQQVRHKQVWKCFTAVDFNQNENASISIRTFQILANTNAGTTVTQNTYEAGTQMLLKNVKEGGGHAECTVLSKLLCALRLSHATSVR